MKKEHPDFTPAQCRNVIWWQNTPRKELRDAIKQFTKENPDTISTLLPEAMGVQVIKTARLLEIPIKPRPTETVYKIALVGYPRTNNGRQTTLETSL